MVSYEKEKESWWTKPLLIAQFCWSYIREFLSVLAVALGAIIGIGCVYENWVVLVIGKCYAGVILHKFAVIVFGFLTGYFRISGYFSFQKQFRVKGRCKKIIKCFHNFCFVEVDGTSPNHYGILDGEIEPCCRAILASHDSLTGGFSYYWHILDV